MAQIQDPIIGTALKVDLNGSGQFKQADNNSNNIAKSQREKIPTNQGALLVATKNDDISVMLRGDRKGNVLIGNYIPELLENFEGSTVNTQKWFNPTITSFVPAQSTLGGHNFNNASITTAAAALILQSLRLFTKLPRVPLQLKQRVRANIFTNSYADFGFGIPVSTTLLVANGACIRVVNGLWSVAITYNSVEIATANIVAEDGLTQLNTANGNAEYYVCDLIMDDDNIVATVQNTQTGIMVGKANLAVPLSALKMFGATALPVYSRLVNSGTPATAPVFTVTEMQVLSLDWALNPSISDLAGSLGLSASKNPFTGGTNENSANSTAPVSATLSNTAASYTTLGGKFQFVTLAGSVTDYALFAFLVPTGARFHCEGIRISTRNTGAAVATTASTLEWAMGFNANQPILPSVIIRKQIGTQSFPIGAAIEATQPDIDVNFITPEVTESGRYVHVILNLPVGTATAGQIIRGQVMIKGRFI